jgi:acyl-CoA dehydrogenase
LARDAAASYDAGADRRILPSAAKLFCSEMLGTVADLAVQIHGGSGYLHGMAVERIYREARVLRIFEGTSEIQRLIIGSRLVKDARTGRTP